MYTAYKNGDKHEPCGTPARADLLVDRYSSWRTLNVLFSMNDFIIVTIFIGVPIWRSLWRRPSFYTRSMAFSTSRNIAAVFSPLFALKQRRSIRFVSCSVVECWARNAFCSIRVLEPITAIGFCSIIHSIIFDIDDRSEIRLWLVGSLLSFFGFRMVIIIAQFYIVGKYSILKHQFNILVKVIIAFFGNSLNSVFVILSSPVAFLLGSFLIMFSIVPGVVKMSLM